MVVVGVASLMTSRLVRAEVAVADSQGPVTPINPSAAPAIVPIAKPGPPGVGGAIPVPGRTSQPKTGAQRTGGALLIVGGVLALASVSLIVLGHRHQDDLNPDSETLYVGLGGVTLLSSFVTLTAGVVLWLPSDGSTIQPSHPQMVMAPRGATMWFTF